MNSNTHFVIGIRNKIPYKISGPDYIVTDNSDYTLELVTDEQWEGMETKTVIYAYDNGTAVHNPINGNQDKIPIIQASGNLHIGVTAGDIRTSTWVSVPIRGSIRRKAGTGIKPPAPDVYDKIMDMIGKQTGIKSVEIQEGSVTDEGGVGETPVYYLVITEKSGKIFKEKLPNFEVDPKQIVKLQKGAPTEETEGIQNQLLINKDDWTIYVCTGAVLVLGEYTYFWQQIVGSGGSGDVGTDITLGITGAVVGRTVKITEVDENGKPVKWESADIPAQTDIDSTLSIEGAAADAKAVGDKVDELSSAIANIPSGKDGVGIQSVVQTTTSTEDGGTNVVTVTKSDGTSSTFQVKNGSKGSTGQAGADGHTPVKGTDYFTAADKREIAEEAAGMVSIPDKLPNPNAITFTGAVTGSYDGSAPFSAEIPIVGGGSSGNDTIDILMDVTTYEAVAAVTVTLENPRAYKELYIHTMIYGDESNSSANAMFLRVNNTDSTGSKGAIAWIPQVENAVSNPAKSYGIAFIKLLDDCSFYYSYGSKAANARTQLTSFGEMYTEFNRSTIISTLKLQTINMWSKLGAGSTIKVYGVRT